MIKINYRTELWWSFFQEASPQERRALSDGAELVELPQTFALSRTFKVADLSSRNIPVSMEDRGEIQVIRAVP
jgi:hypothetical protein